MTRLLRVYNYFMYLAAILWLSSPALAGQMDFTIVYNNIPPPSAGGSVKITVLSSTVEFKSTSNTSWSYEFQSRDTSLSRIEVSVSGTPSGWESDSIEYDIPFSYERVSHLPMAVAVVNDEVSDTSIQSYLSKARTLATTRNIADFVEIQQRGRKLFRARLAEIARDPGSPRKKDDIRIAYWLIFSTNFLITNRFVKPDEVSRAAWNFVSETKSAAVQSQDSSGAKRLFGPSTVPLEQIDDLLRIFKDREAILFNKVVRDLSAKIDGNLESDRVEFCPRAYNIATQFREMPEDVRTTYNGVFANQLIASRLAAKCRSMVLGKSISSEDINLARQALSDLSDSLNGTPARREFQPEIVFAEQQRSQLQNLLN